MTKPRDPAATKERILLAAIREFSARGFAGARVESIARRARVNKRMLYHYFGNKEGLFRAILRRKIAQKAAFQQAAPANPSDHLPFWFQMARQDVEWVRLLQWEALDFGEKQVIGELERRRSLADRVAELRERQKKGRLPADLDPACLFLALAALTTFPVAFPQLSRLITGRSSASPEFEKRQMRFLRRLGAHLEGRARGARKSGDSK